MDSLNDRNFTAFISLDWANAKHDVCVQAAGSEQREFSQFSHKPATIDQWANMMHARFGGLIAVALELPKGPIVYALQKFVLFPINPTTLAKYREAFQPSHANDDPAGWEACEDMLKLAGWTRARRVVVMRHAVACWRNYRKANVDVPYRRRTSSRRRVRQALH